MSPLNSSSGSLTFSSLSSSSSSSSSPSSSPSTNKSTTTYYSKIGPIEGLEDCAKEMSTVADLFSKYDLGNSISEVPLTLKEEEELEKAWNAKGTPNEETRKRLDEVMEMTNRVLRELREERVKEAK